MSDRLGVHFVLAVLLCDVCYRDDHSATPVPCDSITDLVTFPAARKALSCLGLTIAENDF